MACTYDIFYFIALIRKPFFGWVKFCPKNKSQPNCHSVDTSDAAVIASNNAISELKKDNI